MTRRNLTLSAALATWIGTSILATSIGGCSSPDGVSDPRAHARAISTGSREAIVDYAGRSSVTPTCTTDAQCPGLCNWKLRQCSDRAPLGGPCERDQECQSGLCNWRLNLCSGPAATGAACLRDEECALNLCNWSTRTCLHREPFGGSCERDQECFGGFCNKSASSCQ